MAKRKRQAVAATEPAPEPVPTKKSKAAQPVPTKKSKAEPAPTTTKSKAEPKDKKPATKPASETIQLVVGSYDRILHGLTATIAADDKADFADTFLFNAHTSAIRCVAVSPISAPIRGQTQKVFLASGSTDERINVYNVSAHPPSKKNQDMLSKVAPRPILENSKNREIGALLHHSSTVTALNFPTRSKLLSSSEDSNIAVTRTRDWSHLSNIKAPIPKAMGRPSGDTAAFGATPSGVNDFAVHPSMKLMISVSKGEKSMRLWNLVTGKKAGVLNFSRKLLEEVGEGRHSTGEGRRVVWGNVDGADEFAVGFDREIVVFGMDSVPKCRVLGSQLKTKIHQFFYVTVDEEAGATLIAVATEDGRILFYSTKEDDLTTKATEEDDDASEPLPEARLVAQLGGKDAGITSRIKDFVVINSETQPGIMYVAGGSSDGKLRLWRLAAEELVQRLESKVEKKGKGKGKGSKKGGDASESVGTLLGTYETQNRITCMTAFMMIPRPEGVEESEDELDDEDEDEDDSDDDE